MIGSPSGLPMKIAQGNLLEQTNDMILAAGMLSDFQVQYKWKMQGRIYSARNYYSARI